MDEIRLRVLLERAVEEEPPMGQLVSDSLLAGRRLAKRRRVKASIAAAVAVALVSVAVPAAFAALRPGAGQSAATPGRARPTAYVWTSSVPQNSAPVFGHPPETAVTPIRLSTGTAYKPLRVPGQIYSMAASPGGTAVYVFSYTGRALYPPVYMTSINGVTGAAGRPVGLARGLEVAQALIAPGGRTAYAVGYRDSHGRASWALIAINLVTGAAHKLLAVTPDAVPVFVGDSYGLILHDHVLYLPGNGGLAAVDVTTGRALPLIKVQHGAVYGVAIAPDGVNAYLYSSPALGISQPGKPNPAWVTPISLATGRAGTPILALADGYGGGDQIAITPDGRTAYLYGEQAVVPVDLVTGRALKPIAVDLGNLPGNTIAISATGGPAYVSSLSKRLQPISVATGAPGRQLVLPGGYSESGPAAFSAGGDVLYVPAAIPGKSAGAIIPIDTSTQQAGRAIRVAGIPWQIVVMP